MSRDCFAQLQQHARERDEMQAALFSRQIRFYGWQPHQFLWVDETSKDMRALHRTFGYALRGTPPIGTSGLAPRGDRISTLAAVQVQYRWRRRPSACAMEECCTVGA